ncbi:hypothetical protein HK101_008369 [Irineochytrium annulatum]|nr:hypothetical protein HK101_008369 [Irineochytrium annulatum]
MRADLILLAVVCAGASLVGAAPAAPAAAKSTIIKTPSSFPNGMNFMILGDWGNQDDITDQQGVADSMRSRAKTYNSDLVISVGDNFYAGGDYSYDGVQSDDDDKFTTLWSNVYKGHLSSIPWWVTLGNHDWYSRGSPKYQYAFAKSNSLWYLPAYFYVQRVALDAGAHASFIFIETDLLFYGFNGKKKVEKNINDAGWSDSKHTVQKQLAWIDASLEDANADEFVFVIGHHQIFTCASDVESAEHMSSVADLIAKWQPTAYINGHHHTLAHYTYPNQTLQLQVGSGGNVDTGCAPVDPSVPGQEVANVYGYAHATLNSTRFAVDFISESDEVVMSTAAGKRVPVVGQKADRTYLPKVGDESISFS